MREESKHLWDALREVNDPEFPISVVDMGLIYDIRYTNGTVEVDLTFTAMGCPAMTFILDDVRERLQQEPDVSEVDINIVWSPPWTAARMSEEGREQMRAWGVVV
ncbi:MAG: metal-sulfur cluster assembly factor [Chloroflexota bacterium]|nr:metal-sulfur cluster assembly factor [Chloroflexota bacterium]